MPPLPRHPNIAHKFYSCHPNYPPPHPTKGKLQLINKLPPWTMSASQGWAIALSLLRSLLFRSFQKEATRSDFFFALFKKSNKEQFSLLLFTKRAKRAICSSVFTKIAKWANCSFALYKKSNKEGFALSHFSKRATKSNLLFPSLPKERKSAQKRESFFFLLLCSF